MNKFIRVFESKKILALLLIGFSSGLPYLLTNKTLQAWMTQEGVNLTAIGLFSLVGLPYSLKFLWSPFMDRFVPPFYGRRRGWLIITQLLLVVAIAFMSLQRPKEALFLVAINAVFIAFISASQDIVADAYRTDILEVQEMGAGAATFVLGYRIALLLTGSIALILADLMPFNLVYLFLAGLMLLTVSFTLFAPEPKFDNNSPKSLRDAVILPFQEFFQRSGVISGILMLLFINLYRLGDSFLANMSTPFLLQTGFTQTDIGAIQGGMGLLATIVGTLAGGAVMSKIGINRALWIFGGIQAISNLSYFVLAQVGQNYPIMILTINIENFCGGLGTASFIAFLMSLCNQQFSATQYALLSSLYAVGRDILVAPAGKIVENIGWSWFFLFTIILALPGLLLLPWFAPWNPKLPSIPRPGSE
jgi:MFS transporter, PAT family, beta-lactamase induction signal transducer AmpG